MVAPQKGYRERELHVLIIVNASGPKSLQLDSDGVNISGTPG